MGGGLRRLWGPLQVTCVLAAAGIAVAFSISPIWAQSGRGAAPIPDKPNLGSIGERINANTIAIVSGNLNATYLSIAYDLSAVLDDGDNFRVLPVIGKGGGQNLRDVRFLKGVDRKSCTIAPPLQAATEAPAGPASITIEAPPLIPDGQAASPQ